MYKSKYKIRKETKHAKNNFLWIFIFCQKYILNGASAEACVSGTIKNIAMVRKIYFFIDVVLENKYIKNINKYRANRCRTELVAGMNTPEQKIKALPVKNFLSIVITKLRIAIKKEMMTICDSWKPNLSMVNTIMVKKGSCQDEPVNIVNKL